MKRPLRDTGILATLVVVVVLSALYFTNPLRTASQDPRLRLIGFTVFRSPSASMEPTVHENSIFVVSAWSYWHSSPKVGDIVVFQYPPDRSVEFVKRVIALGGSRVEIRDGVVVVDGRTQAETYLNGATFTDTYSLHMAPVDVPLNTFFVMGDNRSKSADSRSWGVVPRSHILGKVQ